MKQILILVTLLISFGSVSGEEEEFESKYFPELQINGSYQSFADSDLDCSVLEEQIKSSLFQIEYERFRLEGLKKDESEILDLRLEGYLSLDERNALEARKSSNDRSIQFVEQSILLTEERSNRLIPFYTALCK